MFGGILGIAVVAATSAVSTMLSFGTYDYFKNTKKYGAWKAGAASGAVLGAAGAALLLAVGVVAGTAAGKNIFTPEVAGCSGCGLSGLQISQLPKTIGLLTAQSVAGLTMEQVAGLTVTQL
jgi:hypothetical protein